MMRSYSFDQTLGDTATSAVAPAPRGLILQVEGTMPDTSGYLHASELIRQRLNTGNTFQVVAVSDKGPNTWHVYLNIQNSNWSADALKNAAVQILTPYMSLTRIVVVKEQGPFGLGNFADPANVGSGEEATAMIFGLPWYLVLGLAAGGLLLFSSMDGKK